MNDFQFIRQKFNFRYNDVNNWSLSACLIFHPSIHQQPIRLLSIHPSQDPPSMHPSYRVTPSCVLFSIYPSFQWSITPPICSYFLNLSINLPVHPSIYHCRFPKWDLWMFSDGDWRLDWASFSLSETCLLVLSWLFVSHTFSNQGFPCSWGSFGSEGYCTHWPHFDFLWHFSVAET